MKEPKKEPEVFVFGNLMVERIFNVDDSFLEIALNQGINLKKACSNLLDFEEYETVGSLLQEQEAEFVERCAGGSGPNMASGWGSLGRTTYCLGGIGCGERGDFLEDDLRSYGVHPFLVRKHGFPSSTIYTLVTDNKRTFAVHLGAAEQVSPDNIPEEALEALANSQYFLITGYKVNDSPETAMFLIDEARRIKEARKRRGLKDLKLILDLSCGEHIRYARQNIYQIMLEGVDILLANEEETQELYGVEKGSGAQAYIDVIDANFLGEFPNIHIVVQKREDKGAIVSYGRWHIISPAYIIPEDEFVNDNGAGDSYAIGFIEALMQGKSIWTASIWGNFCASETMRQVSPKRRFSETEIKKGIAGERYEIDYASPVVVRT